MTFDPADPPEIRSRRQSNIIEMYEKLLGRGEEETAEELRKAGTLTDQIHFLRDVREFDPKHDEDLNNSAKLRVKNTYEALVELGHDGLAEELRDHTDVKGQARHARKIARTVDDEIDPVTGEFEPAQESDDDAAVGESGV